MAAMNEAVSSPPVEDPRQQEIDTAAAFLSISRPCYHAGNVYLACVATAGLGMCRHLRAEFEQCAKLHQDGSRQRLFQIGQERCPDTKDKSACAAKIVLQHYIPRPSPPR